jgi:hypothetical protein
VGLTDNIHCTPEAYFIARTERDFGLRRDVVLPRHPGSIIAYTITNSDGSVARFDNYWLPPASYDAAFAAAGLTLKWVQPVIDVSESAGELKPEQRQRDYWSLFADSDTSVIACFAGTTTT